MPYDEFGAEVYEYIDARPVGHLRHALARQGRGSDVPVDVRFADAYEVKDGKIVRAILGYPDVATALADLGLAE